MGWGIGADRNTGLCRKQTADENLPKDTGRSPLCSVTREGRKFQQRGHVCVYTAGCGPHRGHTNCRATTLRSQLKKKRRLSRHSGPEGVKRLPGDAFLAGRAGRSGRRWHREPSPGRALGAGTEAPLRGGRARLHRSPGRDVGVPQRPQRCFRSAASEEEPGAEAGEASEEFPGTGFQKVARRTEAGRGGRAGGGWGVSDGGFVSAFRGGLHFTRPAGPLNWRGPCVSPRLTSWAA